MDSTEELLKELTEASGISGYEDEARQAIRKHLAPLGELSYDRLGSLICRKTGSSAEPRVMLAAHMDELGFIVSNITREGFIKFTPVGGWWDHTLLAQRVIIKTGWGDVPGMIGAKSPHLLSDEERKKLLDRKEMYIDIGATTKEEVEAAGVTPADPVVPVSPFTILANCKTYMGKAFDDRSGCGVMIKALQQLGESGHPNTVFGVATVQEEIGLRGARTSVAAVNPDVAIVLEGTAATDLPGLGGDEQRFSIGGGTIVTVYREDMVPNLKLRDLVIATARENKIPIQLRAGGIRGSTDGAAIHLYGTGVPTLVLSLPVRNIHSHAGVMHRADFDSETELVTRIIARLDNKTVADLVSF